MAQNNPYEAIGAKTWIKGTQLGMALLGAFLVGAVIAFPLLILLGVSTGNSLILSAILGPVIGTGGFIGWWLVKKPNLTPSDADTPPTE